MCASGRGTERVNEQPGAKSLNAAGPLRSAAETDIAVT
jgi:hypothetical protein